MPATLTISKLTAGTEAQSILNEIARWADASSGIVCDRAPDSLKLHFTQADTASARRQVEDVLRAASESWPIHVRVEEALGPDALKRSTGTARLRR